MPREPSPPEIHQKKREIIQYVRAGDLVVELDAIEQRRPSSRTMLRKWRSP
jgi:hypothetical protein